MPAGSKIALDPSERGHDPRAVERLAAAARGRGRRRARRDITPPQRRARSATSTAISCIACGPGVVQVEHRSNVQHADRCMGVIRRVGAVPLDDLPELGDELGKAARPAPSCPRRTSPAWPCPAAHAAALRWSSAASTPGPLKPHPDRWPCWPSVRPPQALRRIHQAVPAIPLFGLVFDVQDRQRQIACDPRKQLKVRTHLGIARGGSQDHVVKQFDRAGPSRDDRHDCFDCPVRSGNEMIASPRP